MKYKLLFDQFIDGVDEGSKLSKTDQESLNSMIQKMKTYYEWDEFQPFLQKSSQNCSEMLVSVGMRLYFF